MLQQAHVLACKGGTTVFQGRWVFRYSIDRIGAAGGSLGAVVILLLWLYITGFAILIGLNWIIEAADKGQLQQSETTQVQRRAA